MLTDAYSSRLTMQGNDYSDPATSLPHNPTPPPHSASLRPPSFPLHPLRDTPRPKEDAPCQEEPMPAESDLAPKAASLEKACIRKQHIKHSGRDCETNEMPGRVFPRVASSRSRIGSTTQRAKRNGHANPQTRASLGKCKSAAENH